MKKCLTRISVLLETNQANAMKTKRKQPKRIISLCGGFSVNDTIVDGMMAELAITAEKRDEEFDRNKPSGKPANKQKQ